MANNELKKYLFLASLALALVTGTAIYFADLRWRTNTALRDLDSRVAVDLSLRALRLRQFFEAKRTDLAVLSESKEVKSYIAAFEKLNKPDYQSVKDHFGGIRRSDGNSFIKLYSSILDWAKSCTGYFVFHDIFIVNPAGDVIFSVARGEDFGSNLFTGPYASSELGTTFQKSMERKSYYASDFAHMPGEDSTVAAFMGVALLDGERQFGALIVRLPTSRIQMEIGGRGSLNYQALVLHSDKVTHTFHGFDSLQTGDLSAKTVGVSYFSRQDQALTSYYNPAANISINTTFPLIKSLIAGLSILLLGLFTFRLYLKNRRVPISATNSIMVQSTWASIIDNPEKIGRDFYNNLFKIPILAGVFKQVGHHADLHKKLVTMMSLIVNNSDRLHIIEAEIQKLAGMHIRLGVGPEHLQPFIQAFVKTVEQQYDGEFSPKLRQAWFLVLNEIGKIFLEAIANKDKVREAAEQD